MTYSPSLPRYFIPRTIRELQRVVHVVVVGGGYFIPRTIRELQQNTHRKEGTICYFIPRTIRELQPGLHGVSAGSGYFIPRTIRELQPHQVDMVALSVYKDDDRKTDRQSFAVHYDK